MRPLSPTATVLVLMSGWIFCGGGCNPQVLVPQAHHLQGDSPGTLRSGEMSGGIGIGGFENFDIFSDIAFRGFQGNAELTRGLSEVLDLRLLWTSAWMFAHDSAGVDYFRETGLEKDIHAGALRLKLNPWRNPLWSMTAGAGIGTTQGQWFYSLEHVQILGIENRFFVPYANLKWMVNIPISPRVIAWDSTAHWDAYAKTPRRTWGTEFLAGLKLPLANRGSNPTYVRLETAVTSLRDGYIDRDAEWSEILMFSAGAAIVFPLR